MFACLECGRRFRTPRATKRHPGRAPGVRRNGHRHRPRRPRALTRWEVWEAQAEENPS